jgi:thioesterase domain-containing protein
MVSLFPLQPYGSKPPFYWLHGEVSDAYLPRYLGPDQPVYTLGHQSEDGKRARYQTVEAIASHCVSEMRAIQPKGPYYIGGFCLGGLIAVEIARQLRSTGENVALLFALEPDAFKNCSRSITAAFRPGASQGPRLGHDYVRYVEDLVRVEKGQRIIYVLRKVQRQAAHWLDRAMFAIKTVICFACVNLGIALPISLRSFYIRSIYDRATSKYELKVFPGSFSVIAQESPSNATFPWQELATNGVDVSTIPAAGHTDILKEPHIKFWAEKLRTMLQEAQSSRGFKANT